MPATAIVPRTPMSDAELAAYTGEDMADLTPDGQDLAANVSWEGNAKFKLGPMMRAILKLKALAGNVVLPLTADTTLTAAQSGATITNLAAAGTVNATLPAATVGLWFKAVVKAAQTLKFIAHGTEIINFGPGYVSAAGGHIFENTLEATLHLQCVKTGEWNVIGTPLGGWTIG